MVIEIDYSDPVVQRMLAVNEAANASFNERVERTSAEHAKSMENTLEENDKKLKEAEAAYAGKRRRRPAPAEDPEQQNRWPERDKRNLVLSFGSNDEKPTPPPPPPQQRPQARPPEPPPVRERRVLSFSETEGEPPAPAPKQQAPAPKPRPAPRPPEPEPKPPVQDKPRKGRVLNFSTEDEEDEGFQGFRRRR